MTKIVKREDRELKSRERERERKDGGSEGGERVEDREATTPHNRRAGD